MPTRAEGRHHATDEDQEAVVHLLEPLSNTEIEAAVSIVKADSRVTDTFRFVTVVLNEPPKDIVLKYEGAGEIEREAQVILLDRASGLCVEALVSLTRSDITSWSPLEGVQRAIMLDEFVECDRGEAFARVPRGPAGALPGSRQLDLGNVGSEHRTGTSV